MIEIKCSEKTKRNIINALKESPEDCPFISEDYVTDEDCTQLICDKCLLINIKWIIVEENGSHTCEDCKYITFSNYDYTCNTCKNFNHWRDSID